MPKTGISDYFTPVKSGSGKRLRSNSSPELRGSASRRVKMDNELVGEMALGQLMQEFSGLLDTKMSTLATKSDFEELSGKVSELTKENAALKQEVVILKEQERAIIDKLDELEGRSRRNNLIFKGLKWAGEHIDFRAEVRKFCSDMFGCPNTMWVNRAHRLGRGDAIIAHIPDDYDVNYIMKNAKKLKGTGFVVHRDYTATVRLKRACLMAVRGEIERTCGRNQRTSLYFDHLVIAGTRFTWHNEKLVAEGNEDGGEKLREILGRDFSTFLDNLTRNGLPRKQRHRPSSRTRTEAERTKDDAEATSPFLAQTRASTPAPAGGS